MIFHAPVTLKRSISECLSLSVCKNLMQQKHFMSILRFHFHENWVRRTAQHFPQRQKCSLNKTHHFLQIWTATHWFLQDVVIFLDLPQEEAEQRGGYVQLYSLRQWTSRPFQLTLWFILMAAMEKNATRKRSCS